MNQPNDRLTAIRAVNLKLQKEMQAVPYFRGRA